MEHLTTTEIILAVLGSLGGLAGLVSFAAFVGTRLDIRRKRIQTATDKQNNDSVESRRIQLEYDGKDKESLVTNLWKMVDQLKARNVELEDEADENDKQFSFNRPVKTKIDQKARSIVSEIDAMNVLMINDEQTQIFMRRFSKVKELAIEIQDILP